MTTERKDKAAELARVVREIDRGNGDWTVARRLCDELDPPEPPDVRLPKYDPLIRAADYIDEEIGKLLDEAVDHWENAKEMNCADSDGFRIVVGMAFCRALAYERMRLRTDAPMLESPNCLGCGKPLTVEDAWMYDGCPCNSPDGCNDRNLTRWKLLGELQQRNMRRIEDDCNRIDALEAEVKSRGKTIASLQRQLDERTAELRHQVNTLKAELGEMWTEGWTAPQKEADELRERVKDLQEKVEHWHELFVGASEERDELRERVEAQADPDSVGNPAWLARQMENRARKAEAERDELAAEVKSRGKAITSLQRQLDERTAELADAASELAGKIVAKPSMPRELKEQLLSAKPPLPTGLVERCIIDLTEWYEYGKDELDDKALETTKRLIADLAKYSDPVPGSVREGKIVERPQGVTREQAERIASALLKTARCDWPDSIMYMLSELSESPLVREGNSDSAESLLSDKAIEDDPKWLEQAEWPKKILTTPQPQVVTKDMLDRWDERLRQSMVAESPRERADGIWAVINEICAARERLKGGEA